MQGEQPFLKGTVIGKAWTVGGPKKASVGEHRAWEVWSQQDEAGEGRRRRCAGIRRMVPSSVLNPHGNRKPLKASVAMRWLF